MRESVCVCLRETVCVCGYWDGGKGRCLMTHLCVCVCVWPSVLMSVGYEYEMYTLRARWETAL